MHFIGTCSCSQYDSVEETKEHLFLTYTFPDVFRINLLLFHINILN